MFTIPGSGRSAVRNQFAGPNGNAFTQTLWSSRSSHWTATWLDNAAPDWFFLSRTWGTYSWIYFDMIWIYDMFWFVLILFPLLCRPISGSAWTHKQLWQLLRFVQMQDMMCSNQEIDSVATCSQTSLSNVLDLDWLVTVCKPGHPPSTCFALQLVNASLNRWGICFEDLQGDMQKLRLGWGPKGSEICEVRDNEVPWNTWRKALLF